MTNLEAATARRIKNARHAKVLAIAIVAEELCKRTDAAAERLAGLSPENWRNLSIAAGRPSTVPSAETQAMVIAKVAERQAMRATASLLVD